MMFSKEVLTSLITIIVSTLISLAASSFAFVRRVDKIEIMLQNLTNTTQTQYNDLKTSLLDMRNEIVHLDRELQSVKERLRVVEEKTK
jgi:predicted  nucleic acid-binding Zn-ribbon protein